MMLNKFPPHTTLPAILRFLDSCPRYSKRNRCLYALRQVLRIKDIAALRVSDVINQDGTVRNYFTSQIDGVRVQFDRDMRSEIQRYLRFLYSVAYSDHRDR